jgi:arylsulfatase A-like enzyme
MARPKSTGDTKSSAIRRGKYKLIHWYESNGIELYNIEKDPYERNNLVPKKPRLTSNLMANLNSWKSITAK